MEIEFALDKTDLITLSRFQADRSPKLHNRLRKRRIAYVVGFLLLALGTYLLSSQTILPLAFAALAAISALLFPVYSRWLVQRRIRQIVQERATPASVAKRKLRATSEGLEEFTEQAEGKIKWSLIDGIEATQTHAFISVDGLYSLMIPRERVSAGDYDKFVQTVRSHIESNAI